MSTKTTDREQNEKQRDPDFIKAEIALQRAAQKARERAKRAGSGVAVLKDGKIVEEQQDNL
ncbi:hypothetical protein [Desulfofustis limnaeus]|jgi:hypothetical protein|uniref:CMP/dCMP-type deaminase domain-containing protein n=1 Tax=Desulfofustis limnaeus TaxID=2740163 RepID=A0ABN6M082_9BACT|nr:hypothetical protein [Desulfofustis limnaeus]MDX9896499.1 hypothetical protein [Desulfofustis sp.]BDD86255.1 hypothetical protein DPPLL_06200 [Desulfofustis limnaeus]